LLLLKNILRELRDKAFISIRTHKMLIQKLSVAKTEFSKLNQDYRELSKFILTLEIDTLPKLFSKLHINSLQVPALDLSITFLEKNIADTKIEIKTILDSLIHVDIET
jgi:hypothetical protein